MKCADSLNVRGKGVLNTDVEVVLIIQLPLVTESVQIKLLALLCSLHLEAQFLREGGLIPGIGNGLARIQHDAWLECPHLVIVHRNL